MPNRNSSPSDPAAAEAIGEIRGQLREIIHGLNNQAMKSDARDEKLSKLEGVPADIQDIKERLGALEKSENRREGANGIIRTILKSPAIGWLVGAVISAWAVLTGKVHL